MKKTDEITVPVIIAHARGNQHLGKVFDYVDGVITKEHPRTPASGTMQQHAHTVDSLSNLLENMPSSAALVTGHVLDDDKWRTANDGTRYVDFTTIARVGSGEIARSSTYINYKPAAGLLLIDHDDDSNNKNLEAAELHKRLCNINPAFGGAAYVATYSSSAGITLPDGTPYKKNGIHMYYFVKDCTEIEAFIENLHALCWLSGEGFILVAKDGGKHVRNNLFDKSATGASRLIFETPPTLKGGLKRVKPDIDKAHGGYLDTTIVSISNANVMAEINNAKIEASVVKATECNKASYKAYLVQTNGKDKAESILRTKELNEIPISTIGVLKSGIPAGLTVANYKVGDTITLLEARSLVDGRRVCFEDFVTGRPDKDLYYYTDTNKVQTFAHGGGWFDVLPDFADSTTKPIEKIADMPPSNNNGLSSYVVDLLASIHPELLKQTQLKRACFAIHDISSASPSSLALLIEWAPMYEAAVNSYFYEASKQCKRKPQTVESLETIARKYEVLYGLQKRNTGHLRLKQDIEKYKSCDLSNVAISAFQNHIRKIINQRDIPADEQDSLAHAATLKYSKHVFKGCVDTLEMANFLASTLPLVSFDSILDHVKQQTAIKRISSEAMVSFGLVAKRLDVKTIKGFNEIDFNIDDPRNIFLKAPMGSGKTEWCASSIVAPMLELGYKVLILTHRERLSRRNAVSFSPHGDRYGALETKERVVDYKEPWVQSLARDNPHEIQAVSMCVNSIINSTWVKWTQDVDFVIVDELSQVLDYLADGLAKTTDSAGINFKFRDVLSKSKATILMDAGLSDADLEALVKTATHDTELKMLRVLPDASIYQMPVAALPEERRKNTLIVYPCEAEILHRVENACKKIIEGDTSGRFMFACDSLTLPWVVRDIAINVGLSSERILVITGQNKKVSHLQTVELDAKVEAFIADPDLEATKYDIIAFSPAIDSGLSLKADPPHFHNMFGVFKGVAAAPSCLQQLRRLRTAKEAIVYLDSGKAQKKSHDEKHYEDIGGSSETLKSNTRWYDEFKVTREARTKALRAYQGANISAIAESFGFEIKNGLPSEDCLANLLGDLHEYDDIMGFVRGVLVSLRVEHQIAILDARPITRSHVRGFANKTLSSDQRLSVARYYVTDTLGLPYDYILNIEQVKKGLDDTFRKEVLASELILGTRKPEDIITDYIRPVTLRRHEAIRTRKARAILKYALAALEKNGGFMHKDLEWCKRLAELCWVKKEKYKGLGIMPIRWETEKKAPSDTIKTLKSVFANVGLYFRKRKAKPNEIKEIKKAKGATVASYNVITIDVSVASRERDIRVYILDIEREDLLTTVVRNRRYQRSFTETQKKEAKKSPFDNIPDIKPEILSKRASSVGKGSKKVTATDVTTPDDRLFKKAING